MSVDLATPAVDGQWAAIRERYEVGGPTGHGAYGVACSAEVRDTGQKVAAQLVEGLFLTDNASRRTLRELRMLRHLQHENLLAILDIFLPAGSEKNFQDVYIIAELLETDLASILRSPQQLVDDHIRFFLYQVLRGLRYVHSAGVVHCDLKPHSLLVNGNCDLKICDFGVARLAATAKSLTRPRPDTECVFSRRWYRAPEVLCSWACIDYPIDIWSVGCILAEMLLRNAIFPATSTKHQFSLMLELLGSPSADELATIPSENARRYLVSQPAGARKLFSMVFPEAPDSAQQFVMKTLLWHPSSRLDVAAAISHDYMSSLHCPDDEPLRNLLDPHEFDFENWENATDALRNEIITEAVYYHPELQQIVRLNESAGNQLPAGGSALGIDAVEACSMGTFNTVESAVEIFRRFDQEGRGTVPRNLFVQAMRRILPSFTGDDVDAMVGAAKGCPNAGTDGEDDVRYEEFVRWAFRGQLM